MENGKPHLAIVDGTYSKDYMDEFVPLPYYAFDERPVSMELTSDEVCTALLLAHGDVHRAAAILKTPYHRVARLVRGVPRLGRVLEEVRGEVVARAESVVIGTLFDGGADRRQLEWAATKVLQSRLAQGEAFSPAPAANIQSAITGDQRPTIVLWGNGEKVAVLGGSGVDVSSLIDQDKTDSESAHETSADSRFSEGEV